MSTEQESNSICEAGSYRRRAFAVGLITNALVLLLIFMAPHFHPESKGAVKDHEPRAVAFSALISMTGPFLFLFGLYFSYQKFKLISSEIMFKWQAKWSLYAVIGICLFTFGYLCYVVFLADYLRHPGPGGLKPADPEPYELSFRYRADELFLWVGGLLQVAMTMGLLAPSLDAVYAKGKGKQRTKKQEPEGSSQQPPSPQQQPPHK